MRVAITLPSIDPQALVAQQLDAVVRSLAERLDVEVFVESTRLREGGLSAPAFHYLRFDERHAHRAFNTALYPLGRDFLPYEPSYLLAGRFAGVAWILDPAMHHMLLGGLGLLGRWDAYIEALETTMPGQVLASVRRSREAGARGRCTTTTIHWYAACRSDTRCSLPPSRSRRRCDDKASRWAMWSCPSGPGFSAPRLPRRQNRPLFASFQQARDGRSR